MGFALAETGAGWMHDMDGMWGMGIVGVLLAVLLVLGIAALVKYLSGGRR